MHKVMHTVHKNRGITVVEIRNTSDIKAYNAPGGVLSILPPVFFLLYTIPCHTPKPPVIPIHIHTIRVVPRGTSGPGIDPPGHSCQMNRDLSGAHQHNSRHSNRHRKPVARHCEQDMFYTKTICTRNLYLAGGQLTPGRGVLSWYTGLGSQQWKGGSGAEDCCACTERASAYRGREYKIPEGVE